MSGDSKSAAKFKIFQTKHNPAGRGGGWDEVLSGIRDWGLETKAQLNSHSQEQREGAGASEDTQDTHLDANPSIPALGFTHFHSISLPAIPFGSARLIQPSFIRLTNGVS